MTMILATIDPRVVLLVGFGIGVVTAAVLARLATNATQRR